MGSKASKADPERETATQQLSRIYGLERGGSDGDESQSESDLTISGSTESANDRKKEGKGASRRLGVGRGGSLTRKLSTLSTAPMTTTTVVPEEKKRWLTVTSSSSGNKKKGEENLTKGSVLSDVEILQRSKSQDHKHEKEGYHHEFSTQPWKSNTGNDERVRHVTFGGAWEVEPESSPLPPPPPPPLASGAPKESKLRRSQLRKTTIQVSSVDDKVPPKISLDSPNSAIFFKQSDK